MPDGTPTRSEDRRSTRTPRAVSPSRVVGQQPELPLSPIGQQALEALRQQASPAVSHPEPPPLLPVRRLHNFAYCPRLFYYQWVENLFVDNADTVKGRAVHRQADQPSRLDDPKDLDLPEGSKLRSLHLTSETLGLTGIIDVLESGEQGLEIIDYKKGSARRNPQGHRVAKESDAMQVLAYALLLREYGTPAARGWIYYAADKRRVEVPLIDMLFNQCLRLLEEARAVAATGQCPPALVDDPRCLTCSAYPICLPNESAYWAEGKGGKRAITQAPRPEGDDGEILIVQTPGTTVGFRGGEVVVSTKTADLGKFPIHQLRTLYLYGAVQLTTQATHALLEHETDVAYFSPAGRFLGLLTSLPASGVDARLGQYRLFGEPGLRLKLAAEIIRAKIHNQRVLLMRNGEAPEDALDTLARLRDRTAEAADATQLLGLEGAAAAVYFQHFATMLKDREGWKFDFTARNRRPPRDPVNALLSMGYSMLAKELTGVCHAVGLDPFLGFYHQPRYGRPALALDLMEEFRPLIADSIVLSLVNRGEIRPSDFVSGASGCFLNEQGRKAYWENYFRRMDTEITHPQFGYQMSYRRMLDVQARQLWRHVRGECPAYTAFTTR